MRQRLAWLVLCSAIVGCAGAAPRVSAPGDSWARVMALDRRVEVVVHVDRHPVGAAAERFERTSDPDVYRIEGTLAEATGTGLLLRHGQGAADPFELSRRDLVRVFVLERESRWSHVLIGAAAGFGACALGGLLGETDLVFLTEPEWAALCGAGGAGVGYLADRDPATLRLVYERPSSVVQASTDGRATSQPRTEAQNEQLTSAKNTRPGSAISARRAR